MQLEDLICIMAATLYAAHSAPAKIGPLQDELINKAILDACKIRQQFVYMQVGGKIPK